MKITLTPAPFVLACLLFPHLSADEQNIHDPIDDTTRIEFGESESLDKPPNSNLRTHQQGVDSLDDSTSSEEDIQLPRTHSLLKAMTTAEWPSMSAAQRIFQDEILTRFPSHLTNLFNDDDSDENDQSFRWATRPKQIYPQTSSYRNHVVIQPPFRPFLTSDDVRLSLNRLNDDVKPEIRSQRRRKRIVNRTIPERTTPGNRTEMENVPNDTAKSPESLEDVSLETNTTTNVTSEELPSSIKTGQEKEVSSHQEEEREEELLVVDYAGKSTGALIIEKSAGWKGTSNLLSGDKDQYAIVPTAEDNKSLIIGLSEEILVKKIVLSNYERYSSNVKEFQILGSQTMTNWADLGRYTAKSDKFGRQEFELQNSANWARYLKFRVISHYGDEHYLTITQISVHGSTMQQGFHEQWEEDDLDPEYESLSDEEIQKDGHLSSLVTNGTDVASPDSVGVRVSSSTEVAITGSTEEERNAVEVDPIHTHPDSPQVDSDDFTGIEEGCTSCQARGVGSDGYLLFDWILPPTIEKACAWSALSSASVAGDSIIRKHFVELPKPSPLPFMNTALAPPLKSPLRLRALLESQFQLSSQFIAVESSGLSRLFLDEPDCVSYLLSAVKTEIGEMLLLGEFKLKLIRSNISIPSNTSEHSVMDEKTIPMNDDSSDNLVGQTRPSTDDSDSEESATESQKLLNDHGTFTSTMIDDIPGMEMLLSRIPSAACLKELNMTQLRNKSTQTRSSSPGTTSNNPSTGGMEPIFKKLTLEIKSLQAALSLQEKFSRDSISCFQMVLLDLLMEQEREREKIDQRLKDLELLFDGTFIHRAVWDILSTVGNILSPTFLYDLTESLVLQLAKFPWSRAIAWILKNPWQSSSGIGFPLSLICMLVYRRRRGVKSKRVP